MANINKEKFSCSFCGKTEDQVRKLIAGPDGAYICDDCVAICSEIIQEEFEDLYGEQNTDEINLIKPKEIKAFYMKQNPDGKTVRATDLLVPGIGEIIGGSQREERYDVLLDRIKELGLNEEDYWWYLELRKFGTATHSGFGLGFERMLMYLTGMQNIRDVIPFPRTPKNAEF